MTAGRDSSARRWRFAARTIGFVGLWTVALGPALASAQAEPVVLTLTDALSLAEGGNPALRRALNQADLNPTESRTLWFNDLLPRANLTLFNTAFTGNLQRRAFDNFNNPIEDPTADWNYFSRTTHALQLTWEIQGPSLFQSHRRQSLTNADRELAYVEARSSLDVEVQRLYLDALEQLQLLDFEEELIGARETDLDVAQRLFQLAGRTRVDVLNAELEVERQTLTRQQQSASYERALLALRTALGLEDDRAITVSEEPLPLFDPVDLDVTGLISRAIDGNASVARSDLAVRSAALGVSEQRANWWPAVSVGVDVFRRAYEPQTQALFDPSVGSDLEGQFSISFSLPVLNNLFTQRLDQQRASIELNNQRETDRETRLELEATIRGALLELENQWASYEITERAAVIAGEAVRLAREEYRLGSRTFEDLRSAFQQEADTRRTVITARHSFVDALLSLEEAVGAPIRPTTASGVGGR
ncbi:MAG: TolC family protein [Gemmatimonadota bacterium]